MLKRSLSDSEPNFQLALGKKYFAEGLTLLDGRLYQLTWHSQRGFIYNPDNLLMIGDFSIKGEGWGLTNNGRQLIISNGSQWLTFVNPADFSISRKLEVTYENKPLTRLNELEWIDGLIYANIWQSDWLVMIDPQTGKVVARVSLKDILPSQLKTPKTDVLNGIAYDRDNKRLLVTGKYWPQLFHIELTATP